jgi:gas vesicle protein
VHTAIKKANQAAHALLFFSITEIELSREKIDKLKKDNEKLLAENLLLRNVNKSSNISDVSFKISPELVSQCQKLRDEVLKMVENKRPLEVIPKYAGKHIHGAALEFFKNKYVNYIKKDYEVIFSSDLKLIDEKLLVALRNECRDGTQMPLGTREQRTNAIRLGIFSDGKSSHQKASVAIAMRGVRSTAANTVMQL